jgi:CubicO group peptidase (beta-lactamase class C family)
MDIEADKPMSRDTIFRIMSMTKPVSCVALMMLYEEGHFLLDQPISRFLPSFKKMMVRGKREMLEPASREITFRDCLTHTAGFSLMEYGKIMRQLGGDALQVERPAVPGTADRPVNQPVPRATMEEAIELLAKAPLNFHPGTDWEYHTGHEVVGVLIEKISGQRLDQFLKERIFDPLKMVDTHFYLPEEKAPRFAAGYTFDENEWGKFGLIDSPATSAKVVGPKVNFSAGGGLLSTAADYSRFAQMLLNGGSLDGAQIIGRKTIELMTTNHIEGLINARGPGYGYGLGFSVRKSLSAEPLLGSVGSYGWMGAFSTFFTADPKEDLFVLYFTQMLVTPRYSVPHLNIGRDFERLVYQALVGE